MGFVLRMAAATVVVALAGKLFLGATAAPTQVESRSSAAPNSAGSAIGSAGCAASNCHGDIHHLTAPNYDELAIDRPTDSWRSSYIQWLNFDRHASAFKVLENERSRRIMRNWKGADKTAVDEITCLACHVNPALAAKTGVQAKSLQREGVGCEACHGNAELWRPEHTGWSRDTDRPRAYEQTGMTRLFEPLVRAETCAGCHVGAPAQGDIPLREVNHDLIAAGHPRLNFEFTSYLRKLPPHWMEKDRITGRPRQPGYEASFWLIGQRAIAAATLKLLKTQAVDPEMAKHWPELADFNCYACHHDLQFDGARPKGRPGRPAVFGQLVWNRPGADVLVERNPPLKAAMDEIDRCLRQPDAARSRELPGAIEKGIAAWARATQTNVEEPRELLTGLDESKGRWEQMDWDEASRLFLAGVAIENSLRDIRRRAGKTVDDVKIEMALTQLHESLRLPRHPRHFDSPHQSDEQKRNAALQSWFELVRPQKSTSP